MLAILILLTSWEFTMRGTLEFLRILHECAQCNLLIYKEQRITLVYCGAEMFERLYAVRVILVSRAGQVLVCNSVPS